MATFSPPNALCAQARGAPGYTRVVQGVTQLALGVAGAAALFPVRAEQNTALVSPRSKAWRRVPPSYPPSHDMMACRRQAFRPQSLCLHRFSVHM